MLAASILASGCDLALPSRRAREDIEHVGFRDDVPDSERGNAVFMRAWWSDDGALLVTQHHLADGLRVWNGRDGRLLAKLAATPHEGELLIHAGRRRAVAHTGWHVTRKLAVFDALDGRELHTWPEDYESPVSLLGWTDDGAAFVVAAPGRIEVRDVEEQRVVRAFERPLDVQSYRPQGALLAGSYNDKRTAELSRRGGVLALATVVRDGGTHWFFELIDLRTMKRTELAPPRPWGGFASFAISDDERRLALGLSDGMWLYDVESGAWGPFVQITGRRNNFLAPMRFSDGGARLVVLCDQLEVLVVEVATGAIVGEQRAPFEDWEGVFRVSADGSRVGLYHFVSDTIELLDGRDASRVGWSCPYFCNHLHNPVRVHFELSPDGRTLAAAHRYGAALWRADDDSLVAPLRDPSLPPAPSR